MKKRFLGVLLGLALLLLLMLGLSVTAWADGNVPYVDANGNPQTASSATSVGSSTTTWNNGWYVVSGDVTIDSRITVSGNVNLILGNGKTLNANAGIQVASGNSLTIYGQSGGTGALIADVTNISTSKDAAIGGNAGAACGTVTINGGNVTAKARGESFAAGIGGGGGAPNTATGAGGAVTVNGGIVYAQGGNGASGIGGAYLGSGGSVTINGGTVTAYDGYGGVSIGRGDGSSGADATVNIKSTMIVKAGSSEGTATLMDVVAGMSFSGKAWALITDQTAAAHTHDFTYSASGATITATCTADGCDLDNHTVTMTVSPPANRGQHVILTGGDNFTFVTGKSFEATTYYMATRNNGTYTKAGVHPNSSYGWAPESAGHFIAEVTLANVKTGEGEGKSVTASLGFTHEPDNNNYVSLVEITGIDAPVASQALDTKAVSSTQYVTLGSITWDPAPADGAAVSGTQYTATLIAYTRGSNYKAAFADNVTATVNGQTANVSVNTGDTLTVSYTFPAAGLISATNQEVTWSADGITIPVEGMFTIPEGAGTATYTVENGTGEGSYSAQTGKLTVTRCGTFTVSVSTAATGTHDAAEATATLTVNKADPTAAAPTGVTATVGQTLADVTLTNPDGNTAGTWTWADSTTTGVGEEGEHIFKANFTPTDPNYNAVENVDVTVTVYPDIPVYRVTINPGDNMTKTTDSGAASQTGLTGAMTDVVYTADEGYYFPENYSVTAVSGISVTRDSYTQITVSGTPTADAEITLTAPTAKTTPDAPTTAAAVDCTTADNDDGKLTGVTTAMEYKEANAASWTDGTGNDITDLVPGTYYVRVKATDTTNASANQELTIKDYLFVTKTAAKGELDTLLAGKTEADYDEDDWTALTQAITDGKADIDNADTTDAVATAKSNAVNAVNAIKTKAEKAAEALAAAKTEATATVNDVNADAYIADDQQTVTDAKTTALAAINAATTEAEVTAALEAFNEAIAECTTQAAVDLAAAKTEATATVNDVNANSYIAADQQTVTNAKTTALAAIDAAATEAEVTAALEAFNEAIAECTTQAAADLATAKTNAVNTVNAVNANSYIAADQQTVTNAKTTALAAINAATTEAEVAAALANFNAVIAGCTKAPVSMAIAVGRTWHIGDSFNLTNAGQTNIKDDRGTRIINNETTKPTVPTPVYKNNRWEFDFLYPNVHTGQYNGLYLGSGTTNGTEYVTGIRCTGGNGVGNPFTFELVFGVSAVTLSKTSATLPVGSTQTLTAIVMPSSAENRTVTWSSSNPNVATVDADGTVTAVAAGTATITVTAPNGTSNTGDDKTATCAVTVINGAQSVFAGFVNTTATVKFNNIDWYIIDDNSLEDGTVTLFSKDPIGTSHFDSEANIYSRSRIKSYLDNLTAPQGSFFRVANAIKTTTITTSKNNSNVILETISGVKLYLLSKEEASPLPENIRKCATASGIVYTNWWLRSPGPYDTTVWSVLGNVGIFQDELTSGTYGVRPALKLDLSKVTFDETAMEFTVKNGVFVDVTQMTLNPDTLTLTEGGDAVTLTASIAPDDATDKTVIWSVDEVNPGTVKLYFDANCATPVGSTLTDQLTVYAKGELGGSATVTVASSSDATKTASCAVTVNPLPHDPVSFMDWNGHSLTEKTGNEACTDYIVVNSSTTVFEDGKWYVVSYDVNNDNYIEVNGTAHLILMDGKTLNAKKGIGVDDGNSLTIYGQSGGTGTLNATGKYFDPYVTSGIGIYGYLNGKAGTITINGGIINASGAEGCAGIGGGTDSDGATVTVNGGTVTAVGGVAAPGIGGGVRVYPYGTTDHGTITINGGTVTASGGRSSEGYSAGAGISSDITFGGGVTVYAGDSANPTADVTGTFVNDHTQRYVIIEPHAHSFEYSADGATVTATCTADHCNLDDGTDDHNHAVTLTVTAPTLTVYGQTGDSYSANATLTGLETFNTVTGLELEETSIAYYEATKTVTEDQTTYTKEDGATALTGAPTNAGDYLAEIAVTAGNDTVTASLGYTIAKAEQAAPAAPTKAGITVSSVTLTAVDGCEYKCGDGEWQDSPTFTGLALATQYSFYQRLKETDNYNASPSSEAVSISTHVHEWSFAAGTGENANTVTATCADSDGGHGETKTATLTISAEGGTYDGSTAYGATVTGSIDGVETPAVSYYAADGEGQKTGDALTDAPTNAGDYWAEITLGTGDNKATAHVVYAIDRADPTANAPTGLTATYGQTLEDVSLENKNPTGNTPGVWEWKDSTQSVGGVVSPAAAFKANFTPDDADNYKAVEDVDVTVTVGQALNPTLVTGTATVMRGGNTVDLANNVDQNGCTGTVSYAISGDKNGCTLNGSVLTSGANTGTVTVYVTVEETQNYKALSETAITVSVTGKNAQTITADDVAATYGDTDKSVSASVTDPETGGGAISYAVKQGSGDYIDVNATTGVLTIKKAGTAYVTVTAAETQTCEQATKDVEVTVTAADPTATAPTATATYGQTLKDVALTNPEGNTEGTWAWANDSLSVGTVGEHSFKANFTPKDATNYNGKTNVDVTVTVNKADPTANAPTAAATYGQTLRDVALVNPSGNTKGAWAWVDALTTSVGSAGYRSFKANFTPEDTDNYNGKTNVDVTVFVGKAENPATVTTTASVMRGGHTVDLMDNVILHGAMGSVAFAFDNERNGCTLSNDGVLTSGSNTGTVIVNVAVAADDNHFALPTKAITVTITDKNAQTITADDVAVTYGDTDKIVSAGVTEPTTDGGEISYAVKDGSGEYIEVDSSTGALTVIAVPADGVAYVTVTAAETETYAQATMDVTVTISKADSAAAGVTANEWTCDWTERALVSVDDTTLAGGTMYYALGTDAATAPTASWSTDVPMAIGAGTYYVWYKVIGDSNHLDTDPACVSVGIGAPAFGEANFTLPGNIKSIGESAFEDVTLMTVVEIPDSCLSIGKWAFKGCTGLRQIRIPASVNFIDPTAFDDCANVLVYGASPSAAETFCKDNANCTFVAESTGA